MVLRLSLSRQLQGQKSLNYQTLPRGVVKRSAGKKGSIHARTDESVRQGQGRVYEVFRLVAAMPLSMAAYSSLGCNWSAKCDRSSDYIPSHVKLGADCAGTSFATEVRLSPAEVKPIGKSGQRIALEVLTKYCTQPLALACGG